MISRVKKKKERNTFLKTFPHAIHSKKKTKKKNNIHRKKAQ